MDNLDPVNKDYTVHTDQYKNDVLFFWFQAYVNKVNIIIMDIFSINNWTLPTLKYSNLSICIIYLNYLFIRK